MESLGGDGLIITRYGTARTLGAFFPRVCLLGRPPIARARLLLALMTARQEWTRLLLETNSREVSRCRARRVKRIRNSAVYTPADFQNVIDSIAAGNH